MKNLLIAGILISSATVANAEVCIKPVVPPDLQNAHDVCATTVPADAQTAAALSGCKTVWDKWNVLHDAYYACSTANKLKEIIEKAK